MYRPNNCFCVKVKNRELEKFKTIMLKVNAKTIMKKNIRPWLYPKPAGSVDKAKLGNRMTLH
jgi:hypothetical protein